MAKKLSDKQDRAIAILSQPQRGGLTYEQVADEVGIARSTLQEWRKDDEFNDELKRQIMRNALDRLPDIMASVPDHIINDGNAAMLRTLLQAQGLLTDRVEVEQKGVGGADMEAMRAEIERIRSGRATD